MAASALFPEKSGTYPGPHSRGLAKLGRHHFAHLRAIAEGVDLHQAAALYLGVDHGLQAPGAHNLVVDSVRALARRAGERDWRLVGLTIRIHGRERRPSLEDFIADRDLDGWSEREVQDFYNEAFPPDTRTARREKLRERQLALLRRLEASSAVTPALSDRLDHWFDPVTAGRLQASGLLLLQDLQQRIAQGGRWWRGITAVGETKAARLATFLAVLLPDLPSPAPRRFALVDTATTTAPSAQSSGPAAPASALAARSPLTPATGVQASGNTPSGASGSAPEQSDLFLRARSDQEAIEAWVEARAGSLATAKSYRREARRLLVWLQLERRKGLKQLGVDDCRAYMVFMEFVPPGWISRAKAAPLSDGWAPFRGPLSVASRRLAITVLSSLFDWLVSVGYLARNPWLLVNRRVGDDARANELASRAFTPETWAEIQRVLANQPPSPALHRIGFVLRFVEATGLRSTELVQAKLGDFRLHKGRWVLQVHGKGARNRLVAVPPQALRAVEDYLRARHLPPLGEVPGEAPLLASATNPMESISYDALYKTVRAWLTKALRAATLTDSARLEALRASPHWLRHTFGTRAVERGIPLDVVQQQLGHADPRTTSRYTKAQLDRQLEALQGAFGGE